MKKADKTNKKIKQLYYLEYITLEANTAEKTQIILSKEKTTVIKVIFREPTGGGGGMLRHVILTQGI